MSKAMCICPLFACLLVAAVSPTATIADTVSNMPAGPFSEGTLDGWSERSFEGNTRYELVNENNVTVLKGQTKNQASIFYREESVDLNKTPVINWSWKVDRTFDDINEKIKSGDDFPARLYVVAKTGVMPWNTVAINYVWASQQPIGANWPNPFTDKAQMVVIQSGDEQVGNWTSHSRDVAKDFKELFGKQIDKINGYAVMVDGDNAQKEATAWFGQISFSDSAIFE